MRYTALPLGIAMLAACLAAAPPAAAQVLSNLDGGFTVFEAVVGTPTSRSQPQLVTFTWYPEIPVGEAGYALSAVCARVDRLGGPPGSGNRLVFNATLAPVAGDSALKLRQKRARLNKQGQQNRLVLWTSERFEEIAAQGMEAGVVVHFEIVTRGKLATGDLVACSATMAETSPLAIAAAGGSPASADARSLARRHAALHPPMPRR